MHRFHQGHEHRAHFGRHGFGRGLCERRVAAIAAKTGGGSRNVIDAGLVAGSLDSPIRPGDRSRNRPREPQSTGTLYSGGERDSAPGIGTNGRSGLLSAAER